MREPNSSLGGLVDQYNATLSTLLESHAPLKKRTFTVRPAAPWMNDAILVARKTRRQCECHWRSSRLAVYLEQFKKQ